MIKLIVSDLDGTLIHHHSSIREEDVKGLQAMLEEGVAVAFASGRMYPEIDAVMKEIDRRVHSISQNGAYVHTSDGTLLSHHAFERELLLELAGAAEGMPFLTMLCGPDSYFVERMNEHARIIGARLMAPFHEIPHARELLGREVMCGKMSFFGDVERLRSLQGKLLEQYGERIDAYISDIDCMDVMPRGVSKGTGLHALLKKLDVLPEETVCIGDSFNDLAMFSETPHSFAMAGAHPEVRAKAKHTAAYVADVIAWVRAYNLREAGV
ncbi:HAD family hydrolase [Paenibacillus sp. GD4]|jgi:Cof subfamily protein (haloacid dehalogenase superfamily)|uniref:HAD family hydrolase n=1 Tax=Paenibacillus sp. GD4 TaxID=3068890 RepID=UPI00279689F1|nr:HAD family hydrolase [Paenibacillus sp. GD4]MDQ1910036.1 HAD family hydrolase [Paenibacillus sp. GD4]